MFLRKLDKLETFLADISDISLSVFMPYLTALRDFSKVVENCFSTTLTPGYETHIESFKISYLALGFSITPKVRI